MGLSESAGVLDLSQTRIFDLLLCKYNRGW